MKKLISLILVIAILCTFSVSAEERTLTLEECIQKETAYNQTLKEFRERFSEELHGEFFFDENSDLHLNVVPEKMTDEMKAFLKEQDQLLRESKLTPNGIILEEVSFTLAQLNEINDRIIKGLDWNKAGVNSVGVDIKRNCVSIGVNDPNSRSLRAAVSLSDYPEGSVVIEKTEPFMMGLGGPEEERAEAEDSDATPYAYAKEVLPGRKLHIGSNNYWTSSWGVLYQGKKCYLMAGHNNNLNENVFYDGVNIGKIIFTRVGSGLDCALIERADSAKTMGRTLPNGYALTYAEIKQEFAVGQTVTMHGATSGTRTGRITLLNRTINYVTINKTVGGVIIADYSAALGDSGAPVVCESRPLGIQIGVGVNNSYTAILPLKSIVTELGISLYDF